MAENNCNRSIDVRTNWSRFVQSPAQLGFSRLSKFPPGSGGQLVETLRIEDDERILEVGCGLGILSGRLLETGRPDRIWACEPDTEYLQFSLPPELQPDATPLFFGGDGFSLPLPDNSADRLLTHTVANLLSEDEMPQFHEEVRRVLVPGGKVTHMDGIGGDAWEPEPLRAPETEQQRREKFFGLLKQVHRELASGFVNTADNLPNVLNHLGFHRVRIDTYSSVLRLDNPDWTAPQVKEMLQLQQQAERNRVKCMRNLLEATDRLTPERNELINKCLSDPNKRMQRLRKALDSGRELGWRSSTTLVASGNVPRAD